MLTQQPPIFCLLIYSKHVCLRNPQRNYRFLFPCKIIDRLFSAIYVEWLLSLNNIYLMLIVIYLCGNTVLWFKCEFFDEIEVKIWGTVHRRWHAKIGFVCKHLGWWIFLSRLLNYYLLIGKLIGRIRKPSIIILGSRWKAFLFK